ncbi:MAG: hypothetical protein R6V54_08365, partial [Desulfobacteraceae bacterium]
MLTAAAQNRYGQCPGPPASNSTWLRVYDPTFVVSTLLMVVLYESRKKKPETEFIHHPVSGFTCQ